MPTSLESRFARADSNNLSKVFMIYNCLVTVESFNALEIQEVKTTG